MLVTGPGGPTMCRKRDYKIVNHVLPKSTLSNCPPSLLHVILTENLSTVSGNVYPIS